MQYNRSMSKVLVGIVYVAVMIAVIIGVDVAFLSHHFWLRLAVNVTIVVVFASIYLRFMRQT